MSIAHIDGTGLDETGTPPIDFVHSTFGAFSYGWQVGVLGDATAVSTWGRISNKLYCASGPAGKAPTLTFDAGEEDVLVSTVNSPSNVYGAIMLRFNSTLKDGWVIARDHIAEWHSGVSTTRDSWPAIPDGHTIGVLSNSSIIEIYDGATLVGAVDSDMNLHESNHGLVAAVTDLSNRWTYIDISNAPVTTTLQGASPGTQTIAGGGVFGRQRPTAPSVVEHPQQGLVIVREPYVVADGLAMDAPLFGSNSASVAYARSFSPVAHLAAAASIGLNDATARWLPDTTTVVPRTDISADATEWQPSYGSSPGFVFHASTAPYVDSAYQYWGSGVRRKTTQAMIFDGDHWGQSLLGSSVSAFAWIIVAVLHHPTARTWQDVLASPSAVTDPVKSTDATLRYHDGRIQSFVTGKLSEASLHPPLHRARLRPTILVWSEDAHGGTLGVVTAHGRHFHNYKHANKASFDLRMYLGVNGGKVSADYATEMDLMDISYYNSRLTTATARRKVNRLDHVYGVSGQ